MYWWFVFNVDVWQRKINFFFVFYIWCQRQIWLWLSLALTVFWVDDALIWCWLDRWFDCRKRLDRSRWVFKSSRRVRFKGFEMSEWTHNLRHRLFKLFLKVVKQLIYLTKLLLMLRVIFLIFNYRLQILNLSVLLLQYTFKLRNLLFLFFNDYIFFSFLFHNWLKWWTWLLNLWQSSTWNIIKLLRWFLFYHFNFVCL